jgi:CNT family concentrative nucleoside transporter
MRSLYSILLLTLFSVIVFTSCSEEKKSPESKFKGTWVLKAMNPLGEELYINDTVVYKLKLGTGKEKNDFSTNILNFSHPVKGTWTVSNDSINLNFIAPNTIVGIKQILVETDSVGNASVNYQNEKGTIATDAKGSVDFNQLPMQIKVLAHDDGHLNLYIFNVGTFEFEREIIDEAGFSFISILRGILGMAFLLGVAWLFSANRKAIDWQLVWKGILFQIVIALLVLKAPFIEGVFTSISQAFVTLIGYTNEGINFVFGDFASGQIQPPLITFAFKVLPTIIFFSALMSLLYYWGILQKVVFAFAWVMKKFMRLSGAESLAAAGNVFLGQTESPLLVKPYLLGMTKSEMMCLMTGGMATIAGGVLASYIGYLGGDDPEAQVYFAKHLLTASVISAPAAIVAAKMLVPETDKINEDLKISKDKIGTNALEAISNGTTDGLKLAVNVGAMLIVFISLVALANGILGWAGAFGGLNEWIAANTEYTDLSFEFILGYACAPVVWIMGVDAVDMVHVGELLGQKTILNEFYAYGTLGEKNAAGLMNEKSVIMSTYMLCGFANIASIGIQIGGIGALVPSRKGLLSQLGVKALIGGTIACLLTAVVVGMTM